MNASIAEGLAIVRLATTPELEMWPIPLVCEYIDGINWRLRFPFQFRSPHAELFPDVELEAGEETDFASIPMVAWFILHPTHHHIAKAAVVHDHYYRTPACKVTREQADNALRAGMEALGAPKWKRELVFRAVRLRGGSRFKARA